MTTRICKAATPLPILSTKTRNNKSRCQPTSLLWTQNQLWWKRGTVEVSSSLRCSCFSSSSRKSNSKKNSFLKLLKRKSSPQECPLATRTCWLTPSKSSLTLHTQLESPSATQRMKLRKEESLFGVMRQDSQRRASFKRCSLLFWRLKIRLKG